MDAHQLVTPPKSQGSTRDCDVGVDDLISQQLQNELDSAGPLRKNDATVDSRSQLRTHEVIGNNYVSLDRRNIAYQLDLVDLCTQLEGLYYECANTGEFFNHVASNLPSRIRPGHPLSGIEIKCWLAEVCQERKQSLLERKIPPYHGGRENLDRAIDGWLEIEGRRGIQQAVSELMSSYLLAFGPEESTSEFLLSPACRNRTNKNVEYINKKMTETGKANSVMSMRLIRRIEALQPITAPTTSIQSQGPGSGQSQDDLGHPSSSTESSTTSPRQPDTPCDSSTLRSLKDLRLDHRPAVKRRLLFPEAYKKKTPKKTQNIVSKVDDSSMHSSSTDDPRQPRQPSSTDIRATLPGSAKKSKRNIPANPNGTPLRSRPFANDEESPSPSQSRPETATKPSPHPQRGTTSSCAVKPADADHKPTRSAPTTPRGKPLGENKGQSRYTATQPLTPQSERKRKLLELDLEDIDVIDLTRSPERGGHNTKGYKVQQRHKSTPQQSVEQRLTKLERLIGLQEERMDICDDM